MGRALLSKALIQLSADGWHCTSSLVVVWPERTQPSGLSVPHPSGESLPTHTSPGGPPVLAGSFGQCPAVARGRCSSPLGLDGYKILFVPSETGVSVSLSSLELI